MKQHGRASAGVVRVPRWMSTFSVTKHRHVPARLRPALLSANEWVGRRVIALPEGFSHSGSAWFKRLNTRDRVIQQQRLAALGAVRARQPATWEALGYGFPTPVAVRVHLGPAQRGRFWMMLADAKGPLAYLSRAVDFKRGVVEHAFMTRHPKRAGDGAGLSDQAMANASVVYPALGVKAIELTAGLTLGSVLWPRTGFCPVDLDEWTTLKGVIRQNFLKLHADVVTTFALVHGRPLSAAVLGILANDDPAGVFEVVDIDPGAKVKNALGLQHGLSALLLKGGHWRGHLELNGLGGQRLRAFIKAKRLTLPVL